MMSGTRVSKRFPLSTLKRKQEGFSHLMTSTHQKGRLALPSGLDMWAALESRGINAILVRNFGERVPYLMDFGS